MRLTPCSMDRRKEFNMTEHRRWRDQRQKTDVEEVSTAPAFPTSVKRGRTI